MLLRSVAQLGRGAGGDQAGGRQVADGVGGEIAVGHLDARLGGAPGIDDFAAQLARGGGVAEDAGIDVQKFHAELRVGCLMGREATGVVNQR
ncbi:hypothetical protein D3C76_1113000 [compost metagenome]